MTILDNYSQFAGRHWETGSICNSLAFQGVKAPHTNEAYTEALMLGVSGGVVIGYFPFAYEGYDPMARILTRNTFDPWDTLLSRLGVVQNIKQTAKADKGLRNLMDALDDGVAPIIWADHFSLPYNNPEQDDGMWGAFPIVVYGHDGETAYIADRARVGLTTTADELAASRGRIKKDKFRVITLDPPPVEKLAGAVTAGIWNTLNMYLEKPPKGSRKNFGFLALDEWAKMLTKPKQRKSWAKVFPRGRFMLAGLTTSFSDINYFGKGTIADRGLYADFLDEASVILDKPDLTAVADSFRATMPAWEALSDALLPTDVPLLSEARELMGATHELFLSQGNGSLAARQENDARLKAVMAEAEADFPLDDAAIELFRGNIAERLAELRVVEEVAVEQLKAAMV